MLPPLKLKMQRAWQPAGPAAKSLPIASIWVDSGVSTLIEPFSYLIPEKLSAQVKVGSRVQVPFKDKHLEGIVIARTAESSETRDLKSIYKLLGAFPVASEETIELISLTADFWGGSPYDVIRSAIPPRVALVEKSLQENLAHTDLSIGSISDATAIFQLLPPKIDPISALISLIGESETKGAKLVIVPTARDLNRLTQGFIQAGISFISLDSNLPRAERYRNFIEVSQGDSSLVIGMRAAIFAPIPNLTEIYLHQENSDHYYERRAPYWNTREVAWIRSKLSNIKLILTGYVPSLDVAIDIDEKVISYRAARTKISVQAHPSVSGELIPSKIFKLVRACLGQGPVLFLVPAKGYATAISCSKCRNLAICDCGGKLSKQSAKSDPVCVLCNKVFQNWKCGWCGDARVFLNSRGIERFAEEIGRSFPNQVIIQSSAAQPRDLIAEGSAIVISTAGVEPIANNGYSAVIILQVDRFLSGTSSNGTERAYSNFFAASALIGQSGVVALVHEDGAAIISALTMWNPATISKREIEQRIQLQLPPITGAVLVIGENLELARLKAALESAKMQDRAPRSLRIYGPSSGAGDSSKITLLVDPLEQLDLVALLREINKRRAISKKSMLSFQVNPFSLD